MVVREMLTAKTQRKAEECVFFSPEEGIQNKPGYISNFVLYQSDKSINNNKRLLLKVWSYYFSSYQHYTENGALEAFLKNLNSLKDKFHSKVRKLAVCVQWISGWYCTFKHNIITKRECDYSSAWMYVCMCTLSHRGLTRESSSLWDLSFSIPHWQTYITVLYVSHAWWRKSRHGRER